LSPLDDADRDVQSPFTVGRLQFTEAAVEYRPIQRMPSATFRARNDGWSRRERQLAGFALVMMTMATVDTGNIFLER
jgi:hypothetical protein